MNTNRRLPAEWEPQSAIQFTFPHKQGDWSYLYDNVLPCFVSAISCVSEYEKVLVVCDNAQNIRSLFSLSNISNIEFVEIPSNDTWARDHGAITIIENGVPVLIDFMFNGWGLKFPAYNDNLINSKLWNKGIFNARIMKKGTIVLEGGSIESDGNGTILTTSQCLLSPNRNPHLSKEEIENQLLIELGAKRILWLNHGFLIGDDTDAHIDTLARFCDEHTIAYVSCDDRNDEHYEELKKMESELRSFKNNENLPYKLIPLPMCPPIFDNENNRLPATYANFLIINQAVLVPTYQQTTDRQAVSQIQKCFPDRKIVGIDATYLTWQHGSLHCITMQFPEGVVL